MPSRGLGREAYAEAMLWNGNSRVADPGATCKQADVAGI